jgi:hypothetical protein
LVELDLWVITRSGSCLPGHNAATIALPPSSPQDMLPEAVKVTLADLNTMPD